MKIFEGNFKTYHKRDAIEELKEAHSVKSAMYGGKLEDVSNVTDEILKDVIYYFRSGEFDYFWILKTD